MFAIAFDLVVAKTAENHPKSVPQAYADIGAVLAGFAFDRVQGSLYVTNRDDLANLFSAILALKALPWLPDSVRDIRDSVRDIRAFKVEHWSDFTSIVKS